MDVSNPVDVSGDNVAPRLTGQESAGQWAGEIEFMRSTGLKRGWLAAVTGRYKLVVDTFGPPKPVLFDLKKAPDELTNFIDKPGYQKTVKRLASALLQYAKDHDDPRLDAGKIRETLNELASR
jgi:arylsulfatase A-like enzyme